MKPVCKHTHPFLSLGICPWCEQPIMDGQLKPDLPGRTTAVRRWNIPAMQKALENEDQEVRSSVVDDLLLHGPGADEALPLLRLALSDSAKRVRKNALRALQRIGTELSREQAEQFEQESQRQDEDRALHLLLLGYYFLPSTMFEEADRALQKHFLWFIENAAEIVDELLYYPLLDPSEEREAYERAKQLWLQQLEAKADDLDILAGAAGFFSMHEKEISETLLKKAQRLEPHDPDWSKRLAHLHALGLRKLTGDSRREAAARSLAEYERAYACESGELQRFWMLPDLAQAAFDAGEWGKARAFATDLLHQAEQPGYFYHKNGSAIFHGNLVLGRLTLQSGDIAEAKRCLLESAKTKGDPCLRSGGPDLTLAKELLERGEHETVVEFLQLCTRFWQPNDQRVERWIYEIQNGKMPDFGPNCG